MLQRMKTLVQYIYEAFRINKDTKVDKYNYYPKTTNELRKLVIKLIKEHGKDADLNDIDVSAITDMAFLFNGIKIANIDISEWDVSNVTNMNWMFYNCHNFNSDLSKWNVSNVLIMRSMFYRCKKFNCDLSNWNVSNVEDMHGMFDDCDSLQNIPDWYER